MPVCHFLSVHTGGRPRGAAREALQGARSRRAKTPRRGELGRERPRSGTARGAGHCPGVCERKIIKKNKIRDLENKRLCRTFWKHDLPLRPLVLFARFGGAQAGTRGARKSGSPTRGPRSHRRLRTASVCLGIERKKRGRTVAKKNAMARPGGRQIRPPQATPSRGNR